MTETILDRIGIPIRRSVWSLDGWWDSPEPGWAVNNGQVLWSETRTSRGPHPLINLVSPDLDAALERDEAYNYSVAATAKTPSTELNRQLAEAWS